MSSLTAEPTSAHLTDEIQFWNKSVMNPMIEDSLFNPVKAKSLKEYDQVSVGLYNRVLSSCCSQRVRVRSHTVPSPQP